MSCFTTRVGGPPSDRRTFRCSVEPGWKTCRTALRQVRSLVLGRRPRFLLAENSNCIRRADLFLGTSLSRAAARDAGDLAFRRRTAAVHAGTPQLVPRPDPRDRKLPAVAGRRLARECTVQAGTDGTGQRRHRRCGRSDLDMAPRHAPGPAQLHDAEINWTRRFPVLTSSVCSDDSETKSSPARNTQHRHAVEETADTHMVCSLQVQLKH